MNDRSGSHLIAQPVLHYGLTTTV